MAISKYPKCPKCDSGTIYGRPYGLQIGSPIKGENTAVHSVVLVMCAACGAVAGAYRAEELREA